MRKPAQTYEAVSGWEQARFMLCNVLVVDDEHFIVDLIADILEHEGFAVSKAFDGIQATRAIQNRPPDLVIADITMPYLDGLTLARDLRNRKNPIPVILMSAAKRKTSEVDAAFIAKPFDIDELIDLAHEMTNGVVRESRKLCRHPPSTKHPNQVPASH